MTRLNLPVCAALLFTALVWCVAVALYRSLT
jgi:hypothetical protein